MELYEHVPRCAPHVGVHELPPRDGAYPLRLVPMGLDETERLGSVA
jgi:hypothetical protein